MKQILKKSQKNEIFDSIRKIGLDPLNFFWTIKKEGITNISQLNYENSDYFFRFGYFEPDGKFHPTWCPGSQKYQEGDFFRSWIEVILKVRLWLENLRKEVLILDKWAELDQFKLPLRMNRITEIDNTLFSSSEIQQISQKLEMLIKYAENNFKLKEVELKLFSDQINYIKDSSKRQGRRDWLMLSFGILVNTILTLSLNPEKATIIIENFILIINEVIKLLK